MPIFTIPFLAMGSLCECRLPANTQQEAEQIAEIAIQEVRRIELKYSRYRDDSILSQINGQAGRGAVKIDKETNELLDYAEVLFRASDGKFDISSGILRRAWNFKHAMLPEPALLDHLRGKIGWDKIQRTSDTVYLPETEMEIDFGGYGKEYAADCAAALLLNEGISHGLIDLGGDLRILGPQLDGRPWQIGIQNPRKSDQIIATIPVSSGALATSGDYERFFDLDGIRYCHILDPDSAYPVNYWQSVSVLAPLSIAAGSYSTITMLKQMQGKAWLSESGLAYLLIDNDGQVSRQDVV
ncbi:FAD:protein FMN transferase [Undibacterium sp. Di24W]|uniref:FAD:protein FMN transferase n=1 Tax=Undibacterium sp. Di24W TaxID=3413033 RepID=UPI003BF38CED